MSYVATVPMRWPLAIPAGAARHIRRGAIAVPVRRRGVGDASQVVTQVGAVTTPVLTGALAAHAAATAAATGSAATILGMAPALAVPVIGAAMVGVTAAVIGLIKLSKGCGETCIVTSEWANQAEGILQQNLAAYLALPSPRPISARNTAVSNFNVTWARLEQLCGNPATGDAGRRCIADRARGACKWRDSRGECFNWFSAYLDPIANDADVVSSGAALVGSLGLDSVWPLAAIAGLVFLAVTL